MAKLAEAQRSAASDSAVNTASREADFTLLTAELMQMATGPACAAVPHSLGRPAEWQGAQKVLGEYGGNQDGALGASSTGEESGYRRQDTGKSASTSYWRQEADGAHKKVQSCHK